MPKYMKYIGIGILVLILMSTFFETIIEAFVHFYFFDSLGFSQVFWTYFLTEYMVHFIFFLAAVLFCGINLAAALRLTTSHSRFLYLGQVSLPIKAVKWSFAAFTVLVAWLISAYPASHWLEVLMYLQRSPFGEVDPIFMQDISFYLFSLPLFEMIRTFFMAVLFISLVTTAGAYFILGGVTITPQNFSLQPAVRTHAVFFLAAFFLLQMFSFWLNRYALLFSPEGLIFGITYVDERVRIPVYGGLMALCAVGFLMAGLGLIKRSLKPPAAAAGILVISLIVFNRMLPAFMQRFSVDPNELERERVYLDHHIQSTRSAYGLNEIVEKPYPVDHKLTITDLKNNRLTIENIPLWDYRPLLDTYTQIQAIRPYYDFNDIDIARYDFNGDYRQIMLAPRELDQRRLPADSQTWVNKTFVYTHGYGVVASPVNVFTEEGLPELFIRDIPPRLMVELELDRPEIYFGERTNETIVVKAGTEEFDYPYGETNEFTTYIEETGVGTGSLFRRLIFSIYFGTINYLITDYILPESRIVYFRNIHQRVRTLAPFLSYDHDPYITIVDGRMYWIYDAYTTTSRYPYSRPYAQNLNYIRNSVKVVIDAYNGETIFYTIGEGTDPLIRAYQRVFPDLFVSIDNMPQGLRNQVRYPQDLFDIQASMFRVYHMRDPVMFYNREDVWEFPRERVFGAAQTMESYYTILRFPDEQEEEFILMMPFTPSNRDNMIAWLSGRSDGDNYGSLLLFRFPRGELVFGPMQIEARIDQTAEIAQQLALWDQAGTRVLRGSQLVIPVENSVLYIKPLFLRAVEGRLPELRRVLASDGNRVVMEAGLEQALERLLSDRPLPAALPQDVRLPDAVIESIPGVPLTAVQELARQALERYESAQRALREGNWAKYGEEISKLREDLQRLAESGMLNPGR
ncbi:MAG: UPF0182 family protein [Syntrophales bacterium]|nr:UPF0182 family protein [Syntrophales bacterium]